jgi:hypothetical protein
MAVFTVFFCGTGSNSYDATNKSYHQGELVSTLARNHLGSEFVDWIIVDGPGSGNLQEEEKWVEAGNYAKWRGTLNGTGWEENVDHAIALMDGTAARISSVYTKAQKKNIAKYVDPQIAKNPGPRISPQELQQGLLALRPVARPEGLPDRIEPRRGAFTHVNVIGWSRGGITCHMFANKLRQHPVLGNVAVRIFACDPVPGNGMFSPSSHRIDLTGANVTDYVGIYSEDERSRNFSPVLPNLPRGCNTYITTMPGRHGTLVGNSSLDGSGGAGVDGINGVTGPGQITRNFAEARLSYWGTNLGNRLHLSGEQCLRVYDQMMGQREIFRAMRNKSYLYFSQSKSSRSIFLGNGACVNFESQHRLLRPTGFVNLHHRDIFQRVLPDAYDMVFDSYKAHQSQVMLQKIGNLLQPMFPNLCAHWREIGVIP